ncbi:MAG TPA: pyruvate carboxylase, partial [Solibacterales bacterium]|nr:pyruvate carboxylase [Bryobacterales bacterium]
LARAAAELEAKTGSPASHTDLMSYLMYPEVFLKFEKARANYGNLECLPTPQFFYGMKGGEEVTVDLEPGKRLVVKFLTVSEPHPEGYRTVFFELNGQPREVNIRDKSLQAEVPQLEKADPGNPGHVGAPIPGAISSVQVDLNAPVNKGDRLLVMEAMKMQTTVYAPIDGMVSRKLVSPGQTVDAKDLLLVIEPK